MIVKLYDIAGDFVLRAISDRNGVHLYLFTKDGLKEIHIDDYDFMKFLNSLKDFEDKMNTEIYGEDEDENKI